MKIRNGFVSNSSSSSFIVIGEGVPNQKIPKSAYRKAKCGNEEELVMVLPIKDATLSFGWDFKRYTSVADRINFALAQINYAKGDKKNEWLSLLENVLYMHDNEHSLRFDYNLLKWDAFREDLWGEYLEIDHQSSAAEGENTEIFESAEVLDWFLFCKGSYIQGGNDNGEPTKSYIESMKKVKGKYEEYMELYGQV